MLLTLRGKRVKVLRQVLWHFPDSFTKYFACENEYSFSSFSFPKRLARLKSLKEVVSHSFKIFHLYFLKREWRTSFHPWFSHLQENMILSWIPLQPIKPRMSNDVTAWDQFCDTVDHTLCQFKLSCVRQIWHIMNQFSVAWFCKWKSLRKLTIVTNIKTPSTLKICVLDSNEKVISTDNSLKALRESLSLALRISQSFRILFILSSPLFAVFS